MASRLSGIDSTDIERHQCHKALKKYRKQEFGGQKSAGLTPLNLSGSATPYWPLRGGNQKFIMFEACEAFVWCLKDHFYAIYGHLKKKKKKEKKKSKNFKVAFLDFF